MPKHRANSEPLNIDFDATVDRVDQVAALSSDILGCINGMICVVALLVALLEERGALQRGALVRALRCALDSIEDEPECAEVAVLKSVKGMLSDENVGRCDA